MRKINTSAIAVGAAMPFKVGSLDLIQDTISESIRYLVSTITNDNSGTLALYGCQNTISGSDNDIVDGVIYYNGETFFAPAKFITLSGSDVVIGTIMTNYNVSATADPVTFSDGTTHNVHEYRYINWSAGASGSGDIDYTDVEFVNDDWHEIGASNEPAFQNSWANNTVSNPNTLAFKKEGKWIVFKGAIDGGASNTTVFTLPTTHRPSTLCVAAAATNELDAVARVAVTATGDVNIRFNTATIYYLDNIRIPII
jgi:hypothetical protein